jgi:hypothetical protein
VAQDVLLVTYRELRKKCVDGYSVDVTRFHAHQGLNNYTE